MSPYTQTGLKLSYPLTERWSGQIHVLNGWQGIADNNSGKSIGAQLAYAPGSTHAGPGPRRRRRSHCGRSATPTRTGPSPASRRSSRR
ncbi:MAG: outer membrane beta-barrel protein [Vicinamibacteria bacterium]|nr:outer membrane beta-barrel protein [Vicinamibacteria bacterium]